MANLAQLVNVIEPMFATPDDMFKQTIYYSLQLYSEQACGTSLNVHVNSETYDTDEFSLASASSRRSSRKFPTSTCRRRTRAMASHHQRRQLAQGPGDYDGSHLAGGHV